MSGKFHSGIQTFLNGTVIYPPNQEISARYYSGGGYTIGSLDDLYSCNRFFAYDTDAWNKYWNNRYDENSDQTRAEHEIEQHGSVREQGKWYDFPNGQRVECSINDDLTFERSFEVTSDFVTYTYVLRVNMCNTVECLQSNIEFRVRPAHEAPPEPAAPEPITPEPVEAPIASEPEGWVRIDKERYNVGDTVYVSGKLHSGIQTLPDGTVIYPTNQGISARYYSGGGYTIGPLDNLHSCNRFLAYDTAVWNEYWSNRYDKNSDQTRAEHEIEQHGSVREQGKWYDFIDGNRVECSINDDFTFERSFEVTDDFVPFNYTLRVNMCSTSECLQSNTEFRVLSAQPTAALPVEEPITPEPEDWVRTDRGYYRVGDTVYVSGKLHSGIQTLPDGTVTYPTDQGILASYSSSGTTAGSIDNLHLCDRTLPYDTDAWNAYWNDRYDENSDQTRAEHEIAQYGSVREQGKWYNFIDSNREECSINEDGTYARSFQLPDEFVAIDYELSVTMCNVLDCFDANTEFLVIPDRLILGEPAVEPTVEPSSPEPPAVAQLDVEQPAVEEPRVLVSTDKERYSVGDTVYVSGKLHSGIQTWSDGSAEYPLAQRITAHYELGYPRTIDGLSNCKRTHPYQSSLYEDSLHSSSSNTEREIARHGSLPEYGTWYDYNSSYSFRTGVADYTRTTCPINEDGTFETSFEITSRFTPTEYNIGIEMCSTMRDGTECLESDTSFTVE